MQFLRKAALASVGNLICVCLIQTFNIILARVLGPEGIGQYRLWVTAGTIAATVVAMGVGTANIYFLNSLKASKPQVVVNSFKLLMILAPLTAAIVLSVIYSYPGYFGRLSWPVILSFAAGAGLTIGVILFRQILVSQMEIRKMVGIELLQSAVLLGGGSALACLGYLTVSSALILTFINSSLAVLILLVFLREFLKITLAFDWSLFAGTLKYGLKLSLSQTIYLLSAEFSYIILGYLTYGRFAEIGLYSRAAAISGLIILIPNYVGPLLMSQWSAVTGEQRARQVEATVRIFLAFGAAVTVATALSGRYIIWLLYGKEFIGAQEALVLLAPSAGALSLFIVFGNLLNGAGRAFANICISAGTFVILAAASLIFIPSFGIRGAALGALCGNSFAAVASWICASKYCSVNIRSCLIPNREDWASIYSAVMSLFASNGSEKSVA